MTEEVDSMMARYAAIRAKNYPDVKAAVKAKRAMLPPPPVAPKAPEIPLPERRHRANPHSSPITFLIEEAAKHFGVRIEDIKSDVRKQKFMRPRHAAMYLARKRTGKSFPQIALIFNRDHSSIVHACQAMEKLIKETGWKQIVRDIESIEDEFDVALAMTPQLGQHANENMKAADAA